VKTVRQRILDHLQTKQIVSALEVSRALSMTPANARHHLAILVDEGAVKITGDRPPSGRGRPAYLYSPARQAQQHNLDRLASGLLEEFFKRLPEEEQREALRRIARRFQGEEPGKGAGSLTQRLNQAVKRLNDLHYQARWEAHAQAPRLTLGHCPFAAILPAHPELCQMDADLLEGLLGVPAQQTARLATDSRGATYCRFAMMKSNAQK
jgi:predicted ArsR family transcriptional regulator